MESTSNIDLAGMSLLVVIFAGALALRLGVNLKNS